MTLRSTNEFNFAGGKEDGNCVATFGVCCVIGYVVSNFYNNHDDLQCHCPLNNHELECGAWICMICVILYIHKYI